jgi:hypothetical protein
MRQMASNGFVTKEQLGAIVIVEIRGLVDFCAFKLKPLFVVLNRTKLSVKPLDESLCCPLLFTTNCGRAEGSLNLPQFVYLYCVCPLPQTTAKLEVH